MRILAVLFLCCLASGGFADPQATQALNEYRAREGRAPLAYSAALEAAARVHADDMAARGFFDHRGSDGSTVGARVTGQGYGWCFVAENIAQGQRTLGEVMRSWAGSRGHRRNMLAREAREFALVEGTGRIWVMVLAAPGC
ncbi:CAP domain-containing protein [Roseobacter sinensis]|uniref:CAP domain-containing protein n=1 Tax=Roseobacter sinensis TaxID=2931391 RepID=A0ABT3BHG1_9RHOB|nr:CAP domain-containing protein [Roseobacter sp. WL0113]MCV3272987.1 CAP domain-containing protein [Roseobacter sp. WL0113]